jgi:hypothetical protein
MNLAAARPKCLIINHLGRGLIQQLQLILLKKVICYLRNLVLDIKIK